MIHVGIEFFSLVLFLSARVSAHILQDVTNTELEAVDRRLTEEKGERLLLRNDVENLMVEMKETERELKGIIPDQKIGRPRQDIYFNAKLSKITTVTDGHTVIFDTIVENVGESYNGNTGIFRASVPGMYLFSLTFLSPQKGHHAHLQLIKNGDEIGRAFAGSSATSVAQSGAAAIFTHLNVNDEVYVREFPGLTGHLLGDNYCSFAGGLV